MKRIGAVPIIKFIVILLLIPCIVFVGDIILFFNSGEINDTLNILRVEKVTRIAVSSEDYNTNNLDLDNKPRKIILNKDSVKIIVNGILNSKVYSYSHPVINCDYMIRLYIKNRESIDCNVINSSNNGTVFVIYKLNGDRVGSFRNDELNNIICGFLDAPK